jgi:NADPH:quinone reductase-like Zn-dependent oxidoreductase
VGGVSVGEPGEGQIRIKVKAAGVSPTDLALRAGYLKDAIPLPPGAVLGFEAAGVVDAAGPGVTGVRAGDAVTALLFGLGGYAEYALASVWARKPESVSWVDAAALPSSAEAAVGVLRQLNLTLMICGPIEPGRWAIDPNTPNRPGEAANPEMWYPGGRIVLNSRSRAALTQAAPWGGRGFLSPNALRCG